MNELLGSIRQTFGLGPDELTVRNIIAQHCRRLCTSMGVSLAVVEPGPNAIEFRIA